MLLFVLFYLFDCFRFLCLFAVLLDSCDQTIALEYAFKKFDLYVVTIAVLILVKVLEIAFKLPVELFKVFEVIFTVRITTDRL